ncbi:exonuclease [Corynebacterium diphtheriae]|nr:exonuclease [Corynebacterium diphtheriae]CAB0847227.1 exonuclease [Corynebacterium diphtheriae]CAB0918108.1 exonuclease [Corynebacterium diphtheriae]
MRIANWNVNSARARVDRIQDFLERHDIDVLAMQETKCRDDQFPEFKGYEAAHFGINQWNGVAILSRVGIEDVLTSFGQPDYEEFEPRSIGAICGGVRVWSLYVPNGREIAHPHYDYKLRWLYALQHYGVSGDTVWCGDFNIAPTDDDVWDIDFFHGKTHVTEPERQAFEALTDIMPITSPEGYTYWDYTAGRFPKNQGMRIDFQLSNMTPTGGFIDVEERKGKGASDHAPVVVDY